MKFFGNLAITDSPQQVCETYPAFQNKVFEMALDPDPVLTGVALDTLGLLGSTVEGKQVLQKTGECGTSIHSAAAPQQPARALAGCCLLKGPISDSRNINDPFL